MGWRFYRVDVTRFIFHLFSFYFILSCWSHPTPSLTLANPQDWPHNFGKGNDLWSRNLNDFKDNSDSSNFWPFDDNNINRPSKGELDLHEHAKMATKVIAGIIIFVVLASFIAFLICLCCPICILAKMRQRRRGFVYQTTANGATATTVQAGGRTTVVVQTRQGQGSQAAPNSVASPPVVAVPNVTNGKNAPYPVQQSVTVMPASAVQPPYGYPNQPQMPYNPAAPYPSGPAMPMPMMNPNAPYGINELPPPYPHHENNSTQNSAPENPPYNPHFYEDSPNPYAPTTAPYPTK